MEERGVEGERTVIAHHEAAVGIQPREGALDLPASPIPAQGASVLRPRPPTIAPVRRDELDAALRETRPQGVAVVSLVPDQAPELRPRPPRPPARDPDRRERGLDERDFRW